MSKNKNPIVFKITAKILRDIASASEKQEIVDACLEVLNNSFNNFFSQYPLDRQYTREMAGNNFLSTPVTRGENTLIERVWLNSISDSINRGGKGIFTFYFETIDPYLTKK